MTYKKAYMTIDETGKRYSGVYDTSNRRFFFQDDFIEICNKEISELNKKVDKLEKEKEILKTEGAKACGELKSLKEKVGKTSCKETKKKMRKVIEDRLGLFAVNNSYIDGPTAQMIMDSVINDMKKEDLWV